MNDDFDKPAGDLKGGKLFNATHSSTTDPDARLYNKSAGATSKLSVTDHAMSENDNGFVTQIEVTQADGFAEQKAAKAMVKRQKGKRARRITVAADKAYDTSDFVADMREMNVTPHLPAEERDSW